MLRVCEVSSCFPPSRGGVERIVYQVSKHLKECGHDVVVLTSSRGLPKGHYHEYVDGMEVYRYPEYYIRNIEVPIIPGIIRHVMREEFDVLHVHGMTPGISDVCVLIGKIKGKQVLLSYHYDAVTKGRLAPLLEAMYKSFVYHAVKKADILTVLSKTYARTSPILRYIKNRIIHIPGGVDVNKFMHQSRQKSLDPFLDRFSHKILYVGKIIHYKGIEYLIRAMPIIREHLPEAGLIISGRTESDDYRRRIKAEIAFSSARDAIYWDEMWVNEDALIRYYHNCDILVLPSVSRREAFGLVLLEAMCAGKPVIATSIPGPCDLVQNGINGFLVPPKDPFSLAKAIISILSNESLRKKMGSYSRQLAKQYDWSIVAERYLRIIESIS